MELPTTFDEIVDEIVRFTGQERAEVAHRVWMEALHRGWNVNRDVEKFQVTPYHFDDKMTQLYRDGDGFIYESLIFWPETTRIRWAALTYERICRYARQQQQPLDQLKILMLGDGNGSDSLYLIDQGLVVDYFEVPDSLTVEFASKRFDYYGVLPDKVHLLQSYEACLANDYDIVVSFEVLEHLPNPLQAIADIAGMLKPGGVALVSEDFGNLAGYVPSHLQSSAHYLGRTPFLFLANKMRLTWYNEEQLFKPYEFTRVDSTSWGDWFTLWADRNIRRHIISRYTGWLKCLTSRSFEITD